MVTIVKLSSNLVSSAQPVDLSQLSQSQAIIIKALSGTMGAAISSVLLFPAENMKTRMMLEYDDMC